jgi:SAM-dependent methyltransferase
MISRFCDWRRLRFVDKVVSCRGLLLDVGCGDGTFLLAAQRDGWSVFGNELNPEPARSKGLSVSMCLDGGPYDCITLWHSLEHMTDPVVEVFRVLKSLLKPDGVIIAAVPDAGGLQARVFGADWFHLDVPRHVMHYDSTSLGTLFRRSDLTVKRKWHGEFEYDLSGWVQSALNFIFSPKNVLFRLLTGRSSRAGSIVVVLNVIIGGLLSLAAIPLAWGGTLIYAGKKSR